MKFKKFYYTQEARSLLYVILPLLFAKFLLNYREILLSFLLSATGLIYCCFTAAALNLALVIKIYYRMQVIKYHEKDTNIRLFKD